MEFYDRECELNTLKKNWEQSASHSMMTTIIGRRRIGKTSLLLKSAEEQKSLYLYVSKDNEQVICISVLENKVATLPPKDFAKYNLQLLALSLKDI